MKSLGLILTRKNNDYVLSLKDHLNIDTVVVSDTDYADSLMIEHGYYNLTATVKKPSAWDKSFFLISKLELLQNYDYFYFIEDDVFSSDIHQINKLFTRLEDTDQALITYQILSQQNSSNWFWWNKLHSGIWNNELTIDSLHKSFNPFCRLSVELVKQILTVKNKYQTFYFHEILFPTLCIKNNMSILDLKTCDITKDFFATFRYRPIIHKSSILNDKIYHPVKPSY